MEQKLCSVMSINGISKMNFELPDKNELYTPTIDNLFKENNIENLTFINHVMNSPDKFDYFIEQFQCLTYKQLINVYNLWEQFNKTNEVMNFFENVITEVQTESSMTFIINHFIMNSTNLSEQLKWINSLGLLKKPNIEFMKEIKKLLTNQLYNYTVRYVSMSIRYFCENNPSCMEYATIKEMIVIIETSIDSQDNMKLFRLLQAIDNLGHFLPSENVTSVVQKILNDHHLLSNDNLRLYTGLILSHFQCEPKIDELVWNVLSNINESYQLRIIMFNSYSQCLTDEKMKKILVILSESLDKQIRSYILSRLVSLLKTQDPSKILSYLTLQKYESEIIQLNKNIGLFSRIRNSGYYEWLQRTSYGNLLMELSLIYNQYSIIPNTMMINIKYQRKDKFINIINVLYLHGNESILQKVIIYLFKTITSRYIPWMNDYSMYIDNQ
ncbi:Lipid transport N terminal, partial [Schistosoma japonicum]